VKWFKADIYQLVSLAGLIGLTIEVTQADVVGMLVAGGLTAIAVNQIWRSNNSTQKEIEADEAALKVALRRGYTEVEAATYLLEAIEVVSQIERRKSLNFLELIRSQNLRAIANLSPIGVPEKIIND
jgi:predicted Zn-dependent protease